ncbi:selenocysteine-specific elongation factor isoform X2 [Rhipicephalus sanguineus]|uniref:selenocysteine-specific elongation factor isoform X2 n=1 Tax=Rhipicephalus sanguineus TaxID=34632 RepID=UPI001893433B|nr:selenocysteine-specific elongation factor isoform X2 [Rhipicephalus sanguineus]
MVLDTFNLNVGVLGHVDSGKTSLARSLSTTASTACFDKNPQSQSRGITLDLGFSSFQVEAPEHLQSHCRHLHFTLVDCPGHASLIRTIIGGAQIIDLMMLVIDVTKGIQTQTAECLVLGEITCDHMLLVLNKIDLLPEADRDKQIDKMTKRLKKTLEKTKFADAAVVPVAANPGGAEVVEIPSLKVTKKVKSIQMFRKPVNKAIQGDRVGVCVGQLEASLLERGLVCSPGHLGAQLFLLARVEPVVHFKGPCPSGSRFHMSALHATLMARASFLSCPKGAALEEIGLRWDPELLSGQAAEGQEQWALLELDQPALLAPDMLLIGSRLDMDPQGKACRLAFHGRIQRCYVDRSALTGLPVFKEKSRKGLLDRVLSEDELVVRSLFSKGSDLAAFHGLWVKMATGDWGTLAGPFGQGGKVRVRIHGEPSAELRALLPQERGKRPPQPADQKPIEAALQFRKYLYDTSSKMVQPKVPPGLYRPK